jgi:type I restriction enzyme, S subunit
MRLEAFLQRFDELADARDALEKIGELVLQLAVQGKLVKQNPKEISALDCIRDANQPLIDVAVDRSIESPPGWVSLPLGCLIATNTGGGTPSKQNPSYWNGPIPWASVKDVKRDKYLTSTIDSISEAGLKDSSSNLIPPYRLLLVTRMGLGKLAINSIPVAINQDLRAIEPTKALDLDFAYLLLKSLKMVGSGMTVKGITVNKLHAMPVMVPPLAEQKRIVTKVGELMGLCDRLEAQQQERETRHAALARAALTRFAQAPTTSNLSFLFHPSYDISPPDLRKSILTLAARGALVPRGPRSSSVQEDFPGLTPLDRQSIGRANTPGSWECCSYLSLTSLVTSGSRGWKEFYSSTGATFLRTQNIKTDKLVLDDVAFVQLPEATEGMRSQVLKDDILITITGANVTKAARVEGTIPEAYVSQHIALTRPRWPEMSPWLHLCFISPGSARGRLEQLAYGDKPGLNLTNIRELVLPVPPLEEQRRIVAKVGQLMALVDELETQLMASRTKAATLLSALVAELTSQTAGAPPGTGWQSTRRRSDSLSDRAI